MGVESFLLASTLRGILAQRLVRVICPHCKVEDKEPYAQNSDEPFTQYKGTGCKHCSETGFLGRSGIFEFLPITDDIRSMILKKFDSQSIMKKAREKGMKTLLEHGITKVKAGITVMGEVLRVTQEV
jgi:general secretion pathway protein E